MPGRMRQPVQCSRELPAHNQAHRGQDQARPTARGPRSDGVGTLAIVAVAVSLRQVTISMALVGIVAKLGLFVWVGHTSNWTVGTSTLTAVTVVLGLLTMVLATIDFVRSRGRWLALVPFALGMLTFAPVIGYSA